jgi:hypothetical protein
MIETVNVCNIPHFVMKARKKEIETKLRKNVIFCCYAVLVIYVEFRKKLKEFK